MPESAPIRTSHPIRHDIASKGYSLIRADQLVLSDDMARSWAALQAEYENLPVDDYLPEGKRYRLRRYERYYFQPTSGELLPLPHTDYFQSTDINAVTGGLVRQFAPFTPAIFSNAFLTELIRFDFDQLPLSPEQRHHTWQVDAHLMRVIATPDEQGQPTPEGIHRDGAAYVTVHLAELENVSGGRVTVYDGDKQPLESFRRRAVMDAYLFNDAALWHGVTPIAPIDASQRALRSILTFDYHPRPDLPRPE